VGLLLSAVRAEDIDRQRGRRALGISGAPLRHTAANASKCEFDGGRGKLVCTATYRIALFVYSQTVVVTCIGRGLRFFINKQA